MLLRKRVAKEVEMRKETVPESVNAILHQLKSCETAFQRQALLKQHCSSEDGWQAVEKAKNALETELNTQTAKKNVHDLRKCMDIFSEMELALKKQREQKTSRSLLARIRR